MQFNDVLRICEYYRKIRKINCRDLGKVCNNGTSMPKIRRIHACNFDLTYLSKEKSKNFPVKASFRIGAQKQI